MGRSGIDYFSLDCSFNNKLRFIEAEFGLTGLAIVVKLLQKIYGEEGYYCEWNEDVALLFANDYCHLNSGGNVVSEVVKTALRRSLFSNELYEKYGILTSVGIQKRYFKAVIKRVHVEVEKSYLLLSAPEIPKNVVIFQKTGGSSLKNSTRNEQSKVKERKVNNNKYIVHSDAPSLFEKIWKLYPDKKGKGKISDSKKKELSKVSYEEWERVISRYKKGLQKEPWRKAQNGSTFFNTGYIDYLDSNYEEPTEQAQVIPSNNKFHNFPERDYDFEELEKKLINR